MLCGGRATGHTAQQKAWGQPPARPRPSRGRRQEGHLCRVPSLPPNGPHLYLPPPPGQALPLTPQWRWGWATSAPHPPSSKRLAQRPSSPAPVLSFGHPPGCLTGHLASPSGWHQPVPAGCPLGPAPHLLSLWQPLTRAQVHTEQPRAPGGQQAPERANAQAQPPEEAGRQRLWTPCTGAARRPGNTWEVG